MVGERQAQAQMEGIPSGNHKLQKQVLRCAQRLSVLSSHSLGARLGESGLWKRWKTIKTVSHLSHNPGYYDGSD
jgi:hypothetical protein